jgi:hypothetical protein
VRPPNPRALPDGWSSKIRETYAYMNQIDDQIRQSRWDTMDAIAEMNYDNLRDGGGYVRE